MQLIIYFGELFMRTYLGMFFRNACTLKVCRRCVTFVREFWDLFSFHTWPDIIRTGILVCRLLKYLLTQRWSSIIKWLQHISNVDLEEKITWESFSHYHIKCNFVCCIQCIPLCINLCAFKLLDWVNLAGQRSHSYGFSPVWMRRWRFSLNVSGLAYVQCGHWKSNWYILALVSDIYLCDISILPKNVLFRGDFRDEFPLLFCLAFPDRSRE